MANKKCVIIGFGAHPRNSWIKSIKAHPEWDLVGIVDTNSELLENVEQLTEGMVDEDHAYMKIEELVRYDGKPDLCIIATPIPSHHVVVKDVVDQGLNFICEKNMASTIYQGRQMVQLALDHPELSTAMGTQRRYYREHWTAKQYLQTDECEIGDLNFIQWNDAFNWGLYRDGWRRWLPELYAEDQMIHWFDLMRYLTGLDIVQVKADCFIAKGVNWQGSNACIANIALAAPDDYHHRHNWVWCNFYGDWQRRGPRDDRTKLKEFAGTRGRLQIDGKDVKTWIYTDEGGNKWDEKLIAPKQDVLNLGTDFESQVIILEQMKQSIESKGKKQPENNVTDVFKSFAAVRGAIESSRTGRTIFVPDYWKGMGI